MFEPKIHDAPNHGSVIVAYGESSHRKFPLPSVLIALGAILLLIISGITALARTTVPLPKRTLALAYTSRPLALPSDAPEEWRRAMPRIGIFPAFIGYAEDEGGNMRPFAVVRRTVFSHGGTAHGLWQILGVTPDTESRLSNLAPWSDYIHGAWLRLWPLSDNPSFSLEGKLSAKGWHTHAALPQRPSTPLADTGLANEIRLDALPNTWPILANSFQGSGFDIHLSSEPPTVAGWEQTSDGALLLEFQFASSVATTTQAELAYAAGKTETKAFTLPDGTVVAEKTLPFSTLTEATSTRWMLGDGRMATLEPQSFALMKKGAMKNPELNNAPESCPGQPIARFNLRAGALKNFSFYPLPILRQVFLRDENGRLTVCWQE